MNLLDQVVTYLAPEAGLARVRARAQAQVLARSYDAAKPNRRTNGWLRSWGSAKSEVGIAAPRLRNAAHDLVRNNPYARRAVKSYVAAAINTGILPTAKTGNKKIDAKIMAAFKAWVPFADASAQLDFYGLQALIARTVYESGSALVRFYDVDPAEPDEPSDVVPFRIQVLEPEYLDHNKNGWFDATGGRARNGTYTTRGIETDIKGRPTAYWIYNRHPGDALAGVGIGLTSVRVPASEIAHIFRVERPGQDRGATDFASVTLRLHDLDEYDEADLTRKRLEACMAMFVTQEEGIDGGPVMKSRVDENGNTIEAMYPGAVVYGKPGQTVTFNDPKVSGPTGFKPEHLRSIAVGLGVTYEELTGDLSQVNYSSMKVGQNVFKRSISQDQWLMLIPMGFQKIWNRFIDRLWLMGIIGQRNYGVEWTTPRWESVDPQKDAAAVRDQVRTGTKLLDEAIVETSGRDPIEHLEKIAETNKLLDQHKIILDSDPRYTNTRGSAQPPDDAAGTPATAPAAAPAKPGTKAPPAK